MPVKGGKYGSAPIFKGGVDPKKGIAPSQAKVMGPKGSGVSAPTKNATPGNRDKPVGSGRQSAQGYPNPAKANPNRPGVVQSGKDVRVTGGTPAELAHTTAEFTQGKHTTRHNRMVTGAFYGTHKDSDKDGM